MVLFIIYLGMQLFVCSVYITNTGQRRDSSYNPKARFPDIPILRQPTDPTVRKFDIPTDMCLFFTFIVRERISEKSKLREYIRKRSKA